MRSKSKVLRPSGLMIFCYLLPAFLIYTYMVTLPIFSALRMSFYNWSGGPKIQFVGIDNYIELLGDSVFWKSFLNNVIIIVMSIIGQIGIAFIFSMMLNSKIIAFKGFHRTIAYFPATISAVVVGFVWMFVFNYDYGLINTVLRALGLDSLAKTWLDNPKSIMYVVSIPIIWQYIGFYMVIILASMSSIDKGIFEMAEIDGANSLQRAIYITLPMIKKTLAVTVMLCISGNMKIFDHIYVMTGGGPGNSSMVMSMDIYKTTFIKARYGYANTLSIAVLILSLALIMISRILFTRPWQKGAEEYDS